MGGDGCSGGVPLINIGFFVLFVLCFVGGFLYGGGAEGGGGSCLCKFLLFHP